MISTTQKRDEFCVSLRVFGDDIDLSEVTRLLNCEPTNSARTGDIITSRNGYSRTVRKGHWHLSSEPNALDLDERVIELLAKVSSDLDMWRALTQRFDVDVFCGVFPAKEMHGFELSPRLLAMLAARKLPIVFDIYAPSPAIKGEA